MKKIRVYVYVLAIMSFILSGYAVSNIHFYPSGTYESISIGRVIDGDTFEFNDTKYRLMGINTPEKNEYLYEQAKEFLKGFESNTITFEFFELDKYERKLGYIHFQGIVLNELIIRQGLATVYYYQEDKFTKQLLKSESIAREKEIGLWERSKEECGRCIVISKIESGKGRNDCSPGNESVIISNFCTIDCSLNEWKIKDSATHIYEFSNTSVIPKGKILTLYNGEGTDVPENGIFFWNNKPAGACYSLWNDAGDNAFMRDKNGLLVSFYRY